METHRGYPVTRLRWVVSTATLIVMMWLMTPPAQATHDEVSAELLPVLAQAIGSASLSTVTARLAAAAGDGAEGGGGSTAIWGSIDHTALKDDEGIVGYDGTARNAHAGADRYNGSTLAGLRISWGNADFEYQMEDRGTGAGGTGAYEYASTNISPYFSWFLSEHGRAWGALGYGDGEITVREDDPGGASGTTDAVHEYLALGMKGRFVDGEVADLSTQLDIMLSRVEVAENRAAKFTAQSLNTARARALLIGERRKETLYGGLLDQNWRLGVRLDSGDGAEGRGLEMGTGLAYTHQERRLYVTGDAYLLFGHSYSEWGANFILRGTAHGGRGLSLNLRPTWGRSAGTADRLWEEDGAARAGDASAAAVGDATLALGYGLPATMIGAPGILTPYLGLTTAPDSHRVLLGGRFVSHGVNLEFEGSRHSDSDAISDAISHSVKFSAAVVW